MAKNKKMVAMIEVKYLEWYSANLILFLMIESDNQINGYFWNSKLSPFGASLEEHWGFVIDDRKGYLCNDGSKASIRPILRVLFHNGLRILANRKLSVELNIANRSNLFRYVLKTFREVQDG